MFLFLGHLSTVLPWVRGCLDGCGGADVEMHVHVQMHVRVCVRVRVYVFCLCV